MTFTALTAAAAISVLGFGAYALTSFDTKEPLIPPATRASTEPAVSTSPVPSENVEVIRGDCSAGDSEVMASDWPNREVPDPVEEMRTQIIVAAIACDYDELERLGLQGREGFGFSFGEETDPSDFWRERESEAKETGAETSEYMRYLVEILDLPHCSEKLPNGDTYYIWPRVHCADHRTGADWDDLKGLYTDAQIDEFRAMDLYYGFRIGILEDGDWQYFNAGD